MRYSGHDNSTPSNVAFDEVAHTFRPFTQFILDDVKFIHCKTTESFSKATNERVFLLDLKREPSNECTLYLGLASYPINHHCSTCVIRQSKMIFCCTVLLIFQATHN